MSIKAVLFDLDGTLLPMDQDLFVKTYFKLLLSQMAMHGYEPERLGKTIWAGTEAMVRNIGDKTNEEVFFDVFKAEYGDEAIKDICLFDDFYRTGFQKASSVCTRNDDAAKVVKQLKARGVRVVLATNPLFPAVATESRIRWAGLEPDDFELYTTYENSRYCKPNPKYYLEIMEKLGVSPEECLMVGNDVTEDMVAATIGMQVFLLTDCLINKKSVDISSYNKGGFSDLFKLVEQL